jgi:tellurite methyltransferase
MMENLEFIKGVDIYLLDQCMKGNLTTDKRVLDAGFGKGRNLRFCFNQGVDVVGIDRNPAYIELLQEEFPKKSDRIIESSIEDYQDSEGFDFIICNAVLHFAENHAHFDVLMKSLVALLKKDGVLFIRMTSDIGIADKLDKGNNGVYIIPDGSPRYLITRAKVDRILEEHKLKLAEPVKTVNVDGLRCMTTLVFRK